MEYASPAVVHHYSDRTRVSFELPPGWIELDPAERLAMYILPPEDPDADDPAVSPRYIVKVVDGLLIDPEAYRQLAQELLGQPMEQLETLSHEAAEVDGFDAEVDVFRYHEPSVDRLLTQVQAFVQVGQVVFSLTGMVDATLEDDARPVFEQALASTRFVLTGAGTQELSR
jgi:hypothetical protein